MGLICADCGQEFFFGGVEQEIFEAQGWTPPKRCRPCRKVRRQAREDRAARRP
jgi:hypothetical protein